MISQKATHSEESEARVNGQLKENQEFLDLLNVYILEIQLLEDEFALLRDGMTDISSAVGAQLDVIGVILNLPRITGEPDSEYRIRLQGHASALAKSGEPETLIAAYQLIMSANLTILNELFPASIEMTAFVDSDIFSAEQDAEILATMQQLSAGGIGTYLQVVEENAFLFGSSADADANGDLPTDTDHGFGTSADADVNGDITPGPGKGGNLARVL